MLIYYYLLGITPPEALCILVSAVYTAVQHRHQSTMRKHVSFSFLSAFFDFAICPSPPGSSSITLYRSLLRQDLSLNGKLLF